MATSTGPSSRRETFTEQARRAQLIEVTCDLIAANGYSGTSLAGIAEAAGITKAAVLYYFPSKAAVIDATYEAVLAALTSDMAAAVGAARPETAPAAYVRSMIDHLRDHPRHVRVLAEAAQQGETGHSRRDRWQPLATLFETAGSGSGETTTDPRTLAVIIGGAIDGIVTERLHDPSFDSRHAAETLIAMLSQFTHPSNAAPVRPTEPEEQA